MKTEAKPEVAAESFIQRVAAHGGHFLVGEYRGSGVSVVEYLDKVSGKKESYVKVVHSLEVGDGKGFETVHLQERIDRSIGTPEQYEQQCWLQRGMRLLVAPRGLEVEKGIKKFSCSSADMSLLVTKGQPERSGKSQ